jgi:hypothetical protein
MSFSSSTDLIPFINGADLIVEEEKRGIPLQKIFLRVPGSSSRHNCKAKHTKHILV